MDVRCERCQTEYEVEDASVSDLGTEVQCSDCGHRFTVRRSPASGAVGEPSAPLATGGAGATEWRLLTTLGQVHDVRDLSQLQKWIVEGRVTRDDSLCRDGKTWEIVGTLSELAPFFAVVDKAQPSSLLPDGISPPLAPLQPPLLTQHEVERPALPVAAVAASPSGRIAIPRFVSPADSLGAVPQAAEIGETEMIKAQPRGSRLAKMTLMVAVAAGIGYAGIRWQNRYLSPLVIASAGSAEAQPAGNARVATMATMPSAAHAAVPVAVAGSPGTQAGRGAAEPSAGAAPTTAAQGYVALNHHDFGHAIELLRRALVDSPSNGTALFGLAEAYRGAGQKAQALRCYHRYLAILPFGPDAGEARLRLRSLEGKHR